MRKQTARVGLSVAVLPMTALALHGLPGGSHTNHRAHIAAAEAVHRGSFRLPGAVSGHAAAWLEADSTTTVNQVGSELVQASSQVQAQGQVIKAQQVRYAEEAAQRSAVDRQASAHYVAAQTASYAAPSSAAPAYTASYSVSQSMASVLACIRQYESGDNYADTSNPYYRGAYQFSWSTWQSVGGTGDPASASPSEQDMRASTLAERDGWGAWSTSSMCGV